MILGMVPTTNNLRWLSGGGEDSAPPARHLNRGILGILPALESHCISTQNSLKQ
jgi:hypothetical protein